MAASMKDIFGGGGGAPPEEPPMEEEPMPEDSGYSEEYMQAYAEYEAAPSAETFWQAVEACVAETGGGGGGGGLAILLGKKGKK